MPLTQICVPNATTALPDVPGDVRLLTSGPAVPVAGAPAHPFQQHLEGDDEVDHVLEPVVEAALVLGVPLTATVGCPASSALILGSSHTEPGSSQPS